jgi:hypothetical protein
MRSLQHRRLRTGLYKDSLSCADVARRAAVTRIPIQR